MSATRQRRLGNGLMVLGLLAFLLGLLAGPARGANEGNFTDDNYSVSGTRSFNQGTNQTTFQFTLSGNSDPNYVMLLSCPEEQTVVSASGPNGKTPDNADNGEGHTGKKFTPGQRGSYTIVFSGDVSGAEMLVKNGSGHKHFGTGSGCPSTPTTTTTTEAPTTTTTAAATTTTQAPTTTTTVEEPVGAGEATTTSTSTTSTTAPAATTTTAQDTPTTVGTSPEATTTTTGVAQVGGEVRDRTTTTTANPANRPAGDGGGQLVESGETAGTNQQRNNTLPVTGPSTSAFLLLAGAALMLGGLAIRFAPPEPKRG